VNIPLTLALQLGIVLTGVLVRRVAGARTHAAPLLAGFGVVILYWTVSPLGLRLQQVAPISAGLHWNWLGKVLALAGAVLVWRRSGLSRDDLGLTMRQRAGSLLPAVIVVGLICAFAWTYEALRSDGNGLSTERLLFQAVMPGLDEELVFRGLLLAFLIRAFGNGGEPAGASIWWAGTAVTFLFAAGHGLFVADNAIRVDWHALVESGTIGAGLLWLRARTGSLVMPVLAHNLSNFGDSFF
jgi:membrane protease YdiL (CAAX protease family)